jgi:hypothetical protein
MCGCELRDTKFALDDRKNLFFVHFPKNEKMPTHRCCGAHVLHDLLHKELCLSVGVCAPSRGVLLVDREVVRVAVDGGRGGEDDPGARSTNC